MDQNPLSIELVSASESDLPTIYRWFDSLKSITDWGGPGMEFPMSSEELVDVTRINHIPTFKLTDSCFSILGFGQYYLRLERIHFGRIAVSPLHRGKGFGRDLMQRLIVQGRKEFGQRECSLFVMRDNLAAKKLYQSLGFEVAAYPEPMNGMLANCDYMLYRR